MFGIEEIAAIVITMLAIEALYATYAESAGAISHTLNNFAAELKQSDALQQFYNSSMHNEPVIEALQNATGCIAYGIYAQNVSTGSVDREIISDGHAFGVYCYESSDNS